MTERDVRPEVTNATPRPMQRGERAAARHVQEARSDLPDPQLLPTVGISLGAAQLPGKALGERQCVGRKKDGTKCGSFGGPTGFCYAHNPEISTEEKRRNAVIGGMSRKSSRWRRARDLMPPRLLPAVTRIERAIEDVESGRLAPARGQAMASLMNSLVRAIQAGEMEGRLRELESAVTGDDDVIWVSADAEAEDE